MLNLNDLYLFVQVVDHGGFAPAARASSLPKSTLSKRVAALEEALGVRLLQRDSRRFAVTEIGRQVHHHATQMILAAEAAERAVLGQLAEPSGVVRITASVPSVQGFLAPLLPELARRWPKLRIVVEATDRFVDVVQEGFDIALRSHFAPLPDSDLVQRRLGFDPNVLVAARGYLARRGVPSHPDDLAGHDALFPSPRETTWVLSNAAGTSVRVTPAPRYFADESTALLMAAGAELGIVCLPLGLCRAHLAAGDLERVLPEWTAGGVTTTLLVPHRRGQLPSVAAVVDLLVARA